MSASMASHLLKALGQRHKFSGKKVYFIHVSLAIICLLNSTHLNKLSLQSPPYSPQKVVGRMGRFETAICFSRR
jgi:hypothetical protein